MTRHSARCWRFIFAAIAFTIFFPSGVFALFPDAPTNKEAAEALAKLPDDAPAAKSLRIGRSNVLLFRSIIAPELYSVVRGGRLEIEAFLKLRSSEKNLPPRSFLFDIGKGASVAQDPKLLAKQILWNATERWSKRQTYRYEANMRDQNSLKTELFKIQIKRAYPLQVLLTKKLAQLMREIVRVNEPSSIARYSWLTIRDMGRSDDAVWLYSPILKKVREITESNRSDSFLGTALSVEDLFVWSGKPQVYDARVTSTPTILAPFYGTSSVTVNGDGQTCVTAKSSLPSTTEQGKDSPMFESFLMVPRKVYRVLLLPRDPITLYGRQVLYLDSESMVPLYKFVYERNGRLWKVVIGGAGEIKPPKEEALIPFHHFLFIADVLKPEHVKIRFSDFESCGKFTDTLKLADFDPSRL